MNHLKKLSVLFLILLSAIPGIFAQNGQRIVNLDSDAYFYIDALFLEQGLAQPNTARPWTEEEFRFELTKIDASRLSSAGMKAYEYLQKSFYLPAQEKGFQGRVSAVLSPEAFVHFNFVADAAYDPDVYKWIHGYEERKTVLELPLELWLDNGFYAITSISLKEEHNNIGKSPSGVSENYFNVLFDEEKPRLDLYFPMQAYSAVGGDFWSLRFGRDKLSWGNGYSGNMMLSDYSDFYDFAALSLYGDKIKFSSVYTVFDAYNPAISPSLSPTDSAYSAMIAHRLDWRIIKNLSITFNESTMFGQRIPELLRDMNYMAIFHNWMLTNYMNSLVSVEMNYTPWKYFDVYGQLAMDEFATQYEADRGGGGGPGVFGGILGISAAFPLESGYLSAGVEWAATSPWLYNRANPPFYYNVRRYWSVSIDEYVFVVKPIGFSYGADVNLLTFHAEYRVPEGISLAGEFLFLRRGEKNVSSPLPTWDPAPGDISPSGQNPESNWIIKLSAEYPVLSWIELGASVNYCYAMNLNNVANTYGSDLELSAFITISFK